MLAGHLGRTVGELEETLSAREFVEWNAYFQIEPFGTHRDNIHAGIIASAIYNVNRGKHSPAINPGDFIIRDVESRRRMESDKTLKALKLLSGGKNG